MSMTRREAAAFNALSKVLGDADRFVPLSVRQAATRAALAAADAQIVADAQDLINAAANEETS